MNRQAFLERRRSGIGGSDLGPICGMDPFRGPLDVYLEKIGAAKDEFNPDMDAGIRLEPIVKDLYQEDSGRKLKRARFRRDKEHEWLIGHPDAIVAGVDPEWKPDKDGEPTDGPGVFEAKVMKTFSFTRTIEKGLSISHQLQGQHYSMLCKLPFTTFGLLDRVEWRFAQVTVEADAEIHEHIKEVCNAFWYNHVVPRVPPKDIEPDWQIELPEVESGKIVTRNDPEWIEAIKAHREAKQMSKDAELVYDRAKHALKELTDGFGTYDGGRARVYYRQQAGRKNFNQKRLLAAQLLDPVVLVQALEGEGYHLTEDELRTILEKAVVSDLERFNIEGDPFEVLQVYHSKEEE